MASSPTQRRVFFARKLHSLSGVIPVGGYLVIHLWTNARALQGRQAYDEAVSDIHHLPYLFLLEIFGIYVPLLFHAAYGVALSLSARSNLRSYPYSKNWSYVLQRVSGIAALAFIAYHVWQFRIQVLLGRLAPADFFPELCSSLSSTTASGIPVVAVVYLLGLAAIVYHFANGLYGFCFSWGITVSRRATRLASAVFGVVGIVLYLLGANTIVYFATGSTLTLSIDGRDTYSTAMTCEDANAEVASTANEGKQ